MYVCIISYENQILSLLYFPHLQAFKISLKKIEVVDCVMDTSSNSFKNDSLDLHLL